MITNKLIAEKTVPITYADINYNLVLKPSALFNYLQDLASENAEELGFGYSATYHRNIGWFLLKYRMEFVDYPHNINKIKILTEARGCHRLFAYRNFKLYNDNEFLGQISSTWSLVDLSNKKLMTIDSTIDCENLVKFEKCEDDLSYDKIPELSTITCEKEFEIRYDDVDVNGHANNANYIIWAFETLDFNFRSNKKLKTLDVVFKKEVKYGSKVKSLVQIVGNTTIHLLKNSNTNEDLCAIKAEWI